jgi:hypothetical protein
MVDGKGVGGECLEGSIYTGLCVGGLVVGYLLSKRDCKRWFGDFYTKARL